MEVNDISEIQQKSNKSDKKDYLTPLEKKSNHQIKVTESMIMPSPAISIINHINSSRLTQAPLIRRVATERQISHPKDSLSSKQAETVIRNIKPQNISKYRKSSIDETIDIKKRMRIFPNTTDIKFKIPHLSEYYTKKSIQIQYSKNGNNIEKMEEDNRGISQSSLFDFISNTKENSKSVFPNQNTEVEKKAVDISKIPRDGNSGRNLLLLLAFMVSIAVIIVSKVLIFV